MINIQLDNLPKGKYQFLVYNDIGQQVFSTSFEHAGGSINHSFVLPLNIKPGFYITRLFNERINFITSMIAE
jgi:hypothetical protein